MNVAVWFLPLGILLLGWLYPLQTSGWIQPLFWMAMAVIGAWQLPRKPWTHILVGQWVAIAVAETFLPEGHRHWVIVISVAVQSVVFAALVGVLIWQKSGRRWLARVARWWLRRLLRGYQTPPPALTFPPSLHLFCPHCGMDMITNPNAIVHVEDPGDPFVELRGTCYDCDVQTYWSYWADQGYAAPKVWLQHGKVMGHGW